MSSSSRSDVFARIERPGHEEVVFGYSRDLGARAIVALHDTTLGPGLGGIRVRDYATEEEALLDVLRLSEAMTWKSSIAGLPFGGGKAVLWGTPPKERRRDVFRWLGRLVESMGGRYIPTEDMGTLPADIEALKETSRFGVGTSDGSGDPSPVTAVGVFAGIPPTLAAAGETADVRGKRFVVQGAGKVGLELVRLLVEAGADVTACDVDPGRAEAAERLGARVVPVEGAHRIECEVLCPCAVGAGLDERTIPELRCRAVAGGANNQLATAEDGRRLAERGIVYAPDFVINGGGVINLADELVHGDYSADRALARTREIGATLERVYAEARDRGECPADAAVRIARERVEAP